MTLAGVVRAMAKDVAASNTRLGVNATLLQDLGLYAYQNAEAIAARLEQADRLEHAAQKWRSVADQLAETLTQNGVGGAAWQFALDRYDEAQDKKAEATKSSAHAGPGFKPGGEN